MKQGLGPGYRILRRFVRFWIDRFYTNVEVRGQENVPKGAAIFAMNHPNNLIDSLMIGYAIERKIHYLATSQIFRTRLLAMFLHNAGVIPVYRKQDDAEHREKNVSTFQACYEVLGKGGAIGIYPEGITHAEPRVKKIKTGAARIALETENQYQCGVRITPVGLNFAMRKSFRGRVFVLIGKPIDVAGYLPLYLSDSHTAVQTLTAELQNALEEQVLHVNKPELDQLVSDIEEIYKLELLQDVADAGVHPEASGEFHLSKKLVDGIEFFNHTNPARLLRLQQEARTYLNRLKRLRVEDALVREMEATKHSYTRFLLRVAFLALGFLPAMYGTVNHFIPYQVSRWLSRKLTIRETDYATVRILAGILLYSVFYAAQIWAVWKRYELLPAVGYGISLPLMGGFAYYYWEKFRKFRNDLHLFYVVVTRRRLMQYLRARRKHLIADLDRARDDYLNAGNKA